MHELKIYLIKMNF